MSTSKSRLHLVANPEAKQASSSAPPAMQNDKSDPTHQRSHAAHLNSGGAAHTKPAGNLRQGSYPSGRKQP